MKKLIVAMVLVLVCAVSAQAAANYWGGVYTTAYDKDTSGGTEVDYYKGYFCTLSTAAALFGDAAGSVDSLTDYLARNYDASSQLLQNSVISQLPDTPAEIVTASKAAQLTIVDYENGQYGMKANYGTSPTLLGSQFLAMVFYNNGIDRGVRVMSNDSVDAANGNVLFSDDPLASDGVAGSWAGAVPEPSTALLLMLGVAGMALKRRTA